MRRSLTYFGIFLLILVFSFRDLILHISSDLIDWLDYPFIVWVMNQNINHISSLDFANLFNTNAFYPHTNTLLFSDLILPQSIMALPFSVVLDNSILVFNLVFFATLILNYLSSFLFWKIIFKNDVICFVGGILVVFSPFFHTQLSHFQMLSYWPLFFSLYFVFKDSHKPDIKYQIITGALLAIQFLASVYLAIFLLFVLSMYYLTNLIHERKFRHTFRRVAIVVFTFLILDAVFLNAYLDTWSMYDIQREPSEYVKYSANLSDYMFSGKINSLIHESWIANRWNSFDKHTLGEKAVSPGFLLSICGLFGLITITKTESKAEIKFSLSRERTFFLLLILGGFLFSLGPRLIFNGTNSDIPLPYHFILKYIPLIDSIRTPARWSFLVYVGIIYFALVFIREITSRYKILVSIILLLIVVEYIPVRMSTHEEVHLTKQYQALKEICVDETQVLLEVPITHYGAGDNIADGLNYISKIHLSSVYHECKMINGYSGYELPALYGLAGDFYGLIEQGDVAVLVDFLRQQNITLVKFNEDKMVNERLTNYRGILPDLEKTLDVVPNTRNVFIVESYHPSNIEK